MAAAEAVALPPWSVDPADAATPRPALGDLLAAPARRWPDRPAIGDGGTAYTFAELERHARTVAAWLAGHGAGPGARVVVLTEKSAVTAVLAVAVWKCGAVYVPLDATDPPGRLRALLDRLRPAVVVGLTAREPLGPAGRWLGREELDAVLAGPAAEHATVAHRPEDAAYVVLAAGPTGVPQGVENSAGALLAYFGNQNEVLQLTADSRVLSLSPFTVDVSFADTLLPLSLGAYVFQFRNLPAGAVLRAVLGRERITHLVAVSMLLELVTGDGRRLTPATLPALELVLTGAQVCDPAVLGIWRRQLPGVRLVHAFGPPEATVFSLSHEVGPGDADRTPVGRPLRGVRVRLVADGAEVAGPGELWIGGEQVMLGYVGQPAETARVLVEADGTRWFRTGDVCGRDGDVLVLHGHGDPDVVWLAGRRSHLSEVRQVALDCPGVTGAVAAVVRRDRREVVALDVTAGDRRVLADVGARLSDLLPAYLRPAELTWSPAEGTAEPVDEVETCPQW